MLSEGIVAEPIWSEKPHTPSMTLLSQFGIFVGINGHCPSASGVSYRIWTNQYTHLYIGRGLTATRGIAPQYQTSSAKQALVER